MILDMKMYEFDMKIYDFDMEIYDVWKCTVRGVNAAKVNPMWPCLSAARVCASDKTSSMQFSLAPDERTTTQRNENGIQCGHA